MGVFLTFLSESHLEVLMGSCVPEGELTVWREEGLDHQGLGKGSWGIEVKRHFPATIHSMESVALCLRESN